jgi:myo-inositol-1(or 4)-monophosphatase
VSTRATDRAAAGSPVISRAALESIATRAGAVALEHFHRVTPERKPDRTLVTEADRAVEAFIATELRERWPDVGIVAEEGTERASRGESCFVVDPIDGTAVFVAGLPTWCVCIGLMEAGCPRAGVVHLPCSAELYTAVDGRAWWNGVAIGRLDDGPPAGDPFVAVHSKAHRRHRLQGVSKLRSLGSAAYHIVLVARGVARAAFLGDVRVWDLAAAGAVLGAVGGVFEFLDGGRVSLGTLLDGRRAPGDVLAGTPAAIAELRTQLHP